MSQFRNNMKIAVSSFKANKKTILLTTIGLTIALSVSFQMLLFLLGSKGALLSVFLTGEYKKGLFGGVIEDEDLPLNIGPDYEAQFNKIGFPSNSLDELLANDVLSLAESTGKKNFVRSTRLCSSTNIDLYYQTYREGPIEQQEIRLIGLSEQDIQYLRSFIFTETVLDENHTLMVLMDRTIQMYVPFDLQFNISHTIAGNISNVTLIDFPLDLDTFSSSYDAAYRLFLRRFGGTLIGSSEIIMVTTLDGVAGILEKMNVNPNYSLANYFLNIDINYSNFGIFSEDRDLQKVVDFRSDLSSNTMSSSNIHFNYIFMRILPNLIYFYDDYNTIQLIILTLTLPPICIAFFMINFSFNLVRTQNIHHINLLKTRGASDKQILFSLILEMIASTGLSIILGSAIGIPLLLLIGKTSGFMEFKSELKVFEYSVSIAGSLVLIIIVAGLILSIIINLPRMIRMSKLKVRNIAGEEERKKKPLWRKINLDVILGILAIISLIVYLVVIDHAEEDIQMVLLMIFGSAAPILIVVSISFLISRFFSPAIKWIGNTLWKREGGTFALSFKNLSFKDKQTSRAVILLVITLTFGIVSSVVPSTIDYNTEQRWNYVLGADIVILDILGTENFIASIEEIDGVESASLIILNDDHFPLDLGFGPYTTSIIGIDPDTFLDTAFMQRGRYGFSHTTNKMIDMLSTRGNILLQKNNLRDSDLEIGYTFFPTGEVITMDYEIVGTFKYFPNLVKDKILQSAVTEKYIVGSIETVQQMLADFSFSFYEEILYVKQSEPNTGSAIKSAIQNLYPHLTVYSAEEGTNNDLKMPARLAIYAMLNSSFITTIISTLAGFTIYSFLILFDRSKELAVIRALGAKKVEIFKAFIFESNLLLAIGMFIGIPLGIGTSAIVSNIITSYYEIPPLVIDVPWLALLVLVILVLIVTTLGAFIPASYASSKEINDLARAT
ncbi:MAG: ABC transporter permease [Candidatus Heimdallarchaeota archaeon]|nr:ABC transporter permease [Candidatus Heimdallarchaeota archaeon]